MIANIVRFEQTGMANSLIQVNSHQKKSQSLENTASMANDTDFNKEKIVL